MPVSTFFGLQTSLRGLLAQQRALEVTGHNIANVNTPGFSRQEAVMAPSDPLLIPAGATQMGGGAQLGSGVDIQAYRRIRDTFLDIQYRAQAMQAGASQARTTTLDRVELALAEPGDNGLSNQLARFWSAWSDFANSPESAATRQALIAQGKTLAGAINSLDTQLQTVAAQATSEWNALVGAGGEIAGIAGELKDLNASIRGAMIGGDTPNDLLDRRDALLDRLSELGQVSTTPLPDGSMTIRFGDAANPLVDDTTVDWPQAVTDAAGGRTGELYALTQRTIPPATLTDYRTQFDAFAATLISTVNTVLAPTGVPFFSGTSAATIGVSATSSSVRASAAAAAGANDLALQVAALRGGTADGAYAAFVSRIGSETRDAVRQNENMELLRNAVDDRRQSASGVSLDEEMTNLVRFQRGYQASARLMSTIDDAIDTLINRTGRVGL